MPTALRCIISTGEVNVGQFLAIDPGSVSGNLPGSVTRDPASDYGSAGSTLLSGTKPKC